MIGHRFSSTLAESMNGGRVVAQLAVAHTNECPYWRQGKRHGPCACGAHEAWHVLTNGIENTEQMWELVARLAPRPMPA